MYAYKQRLAFLSETNYWLSINYQTKKVCPRGIRVFDMKRCGLSAIRYGTYGDKVMGIVKADDYRWTLPIPAGEYRYNTSVEQNDG